MVNYNGAYTDEELQKIKSEFTRIKKSEYYLDHAGTTLYSENQLKMVYDNLSKNLYCNPHTCKITEDLIDQVRFRILNHFNTNSSEYSVVFTSGTTSSLKLVAECFDFKCTKLDEIQSEGYFAYAKENHTSVLGMREIVKTKNSTFITQEELIYQLKNADAKPNEVENNSLLVFSAQCNFSGFKMPLEIIEHVHKNGVKIPENTTKSKWFVCLDAASYVATNFLDLSKWNPDFVCLSFYKMLGYPTGLGALLVSKKSEYVLNKAYFGGGTVKFAMSETKWHRKKEELHARLEDGSLPFLSIVSLLEGFNTLERLIPPKDNILTMQRISLHVFNLAKYLYSELTNLKYKNEKPVVKVYSLNNYDSVNNQGGIINFNIMHSDGSYVGFAEVDHMATIYNIYLRTGCFCNIGACQTYLNLSNEEIEKQYKAGHVCGDTNDLINGVPTGSVRVSIGYMTTKNDVDSVIKMIKSCYVYETKDFALTKENKLLNTKLVKSNKQKVMKVKTICIFPIKSCGSIKINTEWPISSKGLLYDREWMIVDNNGMVLTQKRDTKLCLIKPNINIKECSMTLNFPGKSPITFSIFESSDANTKIANLCQSKVCGDHIEAIDCGDDIGNWLSSALNFPGIRLIRQNNKQERISKQTKNKISLSNQAQYLLINATSVQWLAEKVDDWIINGIFPQANLESVIDRFRGNLIIETSNPLEELDWKIIQIGNIKFKVDGQCNRCQMICINQANGMKTSEPLKTIAKEFQGKMKFGLYLTQIIEDNDDEIMNITFDGEFKIIENV